MRSLSSSFVRPPIANPTQPRWTTLKLGTTLSQVSEPRSDLSVNFKRELFSSEEGEEGKAGNGGWARERDRLPGFRM